MKVAELRSFAREHPYRTALAIAALVGAAGLIIWALLQCRTPVGRLAIKETNSIGCAEFWLNRYQSFMAGMIALGATLTAGYWALSGARGQMAEQRRSSEIAESNARAQINQLDAIEAERRRRENIAARAGLPHALSDITQYARDCMKLLAGVARDVEARKPPGKLVPPPMKPYTLKAFQDAATFAPEEQAKSLVQLISWSQVQAARLEALADKLNNPHQSVLPIEVHGRIVDAAEVHTLAAQLFNFARGLDDAWRPRVPMEDVRSALHTTGIWEDENEKLFRYVEAREQQNEKPAGHDESAS
jgi:hypothetical protein